MVLVDANVLLDWLTRDPTWANWATEQMDALHEGEGLAINQLILAEVAPGFRTAAALDAALPQRRFARLSLPFNAAFLAGQAFLRYRRQEKGEKRSPLPDFYIGAHAQVLGIPLLTRDARRYRPYLQLIAPPA